MAGGKDNATVDGMMPSFHDVLLQDALYVSPKLNLFSQSRSGFKDSGQPDAQFP